MNQNITRSMLLDSFIFGKVIGLIVWHDRLNRPVKMDGIVTGLEAESGYNCKTHLQDFNVNLRVGASIFATYVKTID
jgi:hypothetical protein